MDRRSSTGRLLDSSPSFERIFLSCSGSGTQQQNCPVNSFQQNLAATRDTFDSRSRFEQVFLQSPRAQAIYASVGPRCTPQKSATVRSFDDVFKMAEVYHNNSSLYSSTVHSFLSDQSVTSAKSKPFDGFLKERQFEVSPFKPSVNDSTIKKKVSLVLSRLGSDDMAIVNTRSRSKTDEELRVNVDSGFNDMQSDSGRSSEGTFTNVVNQGVSMLSARKQRNPTRIDDIHVSSTAPAVNSEEEICISFESDSDKEIDVVTGEEDQQINNDKNGHGAGDGYDNNEGDGSDNNSDDGDGDGIANGDGDGVGDSDDNNEGDGSDNNSDDGAGIGDGDGDGDGVGGGIGDGDGDGIANGDGDRDSGGIGDGEGNGIGDHDDIDDSGDKDGDKKSNNTQDNSNNFTTKNPEKFVEQRQRNSSELARAQQQKTSKINVLKMWSIKAVKTRTHMGIIVEGQRNEDPVGELWHSTAIVLRVGPRCVQTKSGSQYKLMGPINDKLTLQQGFSPEFVKSFENGFPTNWVSLVADHFYSQSSSESDDEKQNDERLDKKEKNPSREDKHSTDTATPTESKTTRKRKDLKTPENRQLPKEVEMKTTRSGRMVKPPLAWWRGQRIVTDRDHNFEGIDPGGEEYTTRSSLYNVNIKLPIKIEESSPLKQRQAASDSERRKGKKRRTKITMSTKKKSQQKSSTEESDITLQQEIKSPKWSTDRGHEMNSTEQSSSAGTLQEEINIPKKSSDKRNPQQQMNSNRQSVVSVGNSPRMASSPSKITIRGNSPKAIKSPKQSANRGNSRQEISSSEQSTRHTGKSTRETNDNEKFGSTGMKQQETNTQKSSDKSPDAGLPQKISGKKMKEITRQAAVQRVSVVKPSSNSSKTDQHSDDAGDAIMSSASDQDDNASSSSQKDSDENLKKKLFSSPKKFPNKKQSVQEVSKIDQLDKEEKRADKRKINKNKTQKSKVTGDVVQRRNLRNKPEHVATEEEISDNDKSLRKKITVLSVAEENSRDQGKRTTNAYTDSESDAVEQLPAPKIPSLPKRVLRGRGKKSNNVKTIQKISDVDSEDGAKKTQASVSYDGDSDSTAYYGIGSKAKGRKRNLDKRLVHKRVRALAKETTSTQSSEEDSDETYQKPSRKQTRPKASKVVKLNTEVQQDSGNDKRAKAGSLRGKEKTEDVSNRASGKNQASKVLKQTGNKHSNGKQNEMSDETPWSDEEIQRLNGALCTISGNTPMFWQKISRKVASRTAQECQLKHQGQVLVSNKKASSVAKKVSAKEKDDAARAKASSQQNVRTVTGGVGTIKRKREIRELLEQQDVNYEDDIFDATPFKRKKDLKLPFNLNSNSSDEDDDDNDDDEGDESETEHGGASYKTPSSRTPSSRFRPLGPLPTSSTPSSEFISPSLLQQVNRKDMDHYIYRMQQGKRGVHAPGKHNAKQMRTSTPKKPAPPSRHFPAVLGSEIFEAHPASDHDSEEGEDDYYFSDE